jgi:RNA polymerase sigma-70 factor (ECF subfamily)
MARGERTVEHGNAGILCQDRIRSCVSLESMMPLDHETIVRTLFAARARLSAAVWLVVRDAQAAEDIFQNVTVKALTKAVAFEHEGYLLSWAMVAVRREAIDWLRREKRGAVSLGDDVLDLIEAEWAMATPAAGGHQVEALRDCLEAAPPDAREILELRYFEGRSCAEVGAHIGIGLAAVYQRLSRLHRALKLCIERRLVAGAAAFAALPADP